MKNSNYLICYCCTLIPIGKAICNAIAQFTFTDSIFVETVLPIGWESRKVPLMEENQN